MTTMKVGQDIVQMDDPFAMAAALQKVRIRLSAGQLRETVRMDGEEVTFQRARLDDLKALIAEYEGKCRRKTGGASRTRYAKRFRFTG
ncbi:cytosine/adenosine deaminase-related metal-dependent hydrolase [Rubricella aquisinus]|uniref:Cytosine/adenosine deaminase-related metal-dependent hydrolase n=1 Tax=Rubricella aquisinus TaxID=2028108 RepID=A0A840X1N7_9RHOB|nr:hypothetical protein [Rubricella aquisinus]MBB5515776.1 cytosine/adenosine deaminase-related metal-dependent hydrolase [Rubricella aquisinus]